MNIIPIVLGLKPEVQWSYKMGYIKKCTQRLKHKYTVHSWEEYYLNLGWFVCYISVEMQGKILNSRVIRVGFQKYVLYQAYTLIPLLELSGRVFN